MFCVFFLGPYTLHMYKYSACAGSWSSEFLQSSWNTFTGGNASAGAPSAPPASLFFRFSLTWDSRSSRSTRSASCARHASSSWDTRLLRSGFLFSAPGNTERKTALDGDAVQKGKGHVRIYQNDQSLFIQRNFQTELRCILKTLDLI